MATNINITVGDDDLVARARQEMAAHRTGSNIAQGRTKAGEKGKAERARRLAIQGRDGEGRTIPTAPFTPPRREQELTSSLEPPIQHGEGYFTWREAERNATTLTVSSGNGEKSIEVVVEGSGIPYGWVGGEVEEGYYFPPDSTEQTAVPIGPNTTRQTVVATRRRTPSSAGLLSDYQLGINSTVNYGVIVLPISKDAAIFAWLESRFSYKSLGFVTVNAVYDYNELTGVETEVSSSLAYTHAVNEFVAYESVTTFLITKDSVRKVEAPENLKEAIKKSRYWVPIKYRSVSYSGDTSFIYAGGLPPAVGGWSGPGYGLDPSYLIDRNYRDALRKTYILTYTWGWGWAAEFEVPSVSSLVGSFRYSPAIYDVLSNAVAKVDPPYTYADIKSQINTRGRSVPFVRLENAYQGSDNRYSLRAWFRTLPESFDNPDYESDYFNNNFDQEKWRLLKVFDRKPISLIETRLSWVDWQAAAYARNQLYALGFTPADLKP